ncbi:MAG TPA: ABC transporter ATP-binding protein [Rectinemataceae bacterium]
MNYELKGICLSFGELSVLDRLDIEFPPSSVSAILGPSGCGKTSLLKIVAGLLSPNAGSIFGLDSARVSYCFQEPRLLPWLNVRDNILFALSGLGDDKMAEERADRFILEAGLESFASAKPRTLSGGMKQRVNLARAFAYPSDILLLDEAFASVDLDLKVGLLDLFGTLWEEERRTAIMVTHDIQDALYVADRIVLLSERPARLKKIIDIPGRGGRVYGLPEPEAARSVYEALFKGGQIAKPGS